MDARIAPEGSLNILSRREINQLADAGTGPGGLYALWKQCSLAVLNAGSTQDDIGSILRRHQGFRIEIVQEEGEIALSVKNAPETAFVDGQMIRGVRDQLFAVMRDLLYTHETIIENDRFDLNTSDGVTDALFHILRNAQVLDSDQRPNVVVCWGGHAISREEYDYSKHVGYGLGLRGLDVCTGCGQGAMKGPMKGAALGHAKQRLRHGRYIGLTEPTIISAEAPNPIVNELVILPDMEKRLEAFVRMAHAIVIFPGGAGTAEEILFLLGILLDARNADIEVPVIMTGPAASAPYFESLREFIAASIGQEAVERFTLIIDDADAVAAAAAAGVRRVAQAREQAHETFYFNWRMNIDLALQRPFHATHESMAALDLRADLPPVDLAVNLRRAFSGIVAGNVREAGVRLVAERGPFELRAEPALAGALDRLLRDFVDQHRMKIADADRYRPCYRVIG